jgi:hypothetical protein
MKRSFLLLTLSFFLASVASAQSVDLLYQGKSYTAPFYQGAPLWPKQGLAKFLAIPQGLGSPSSLIYRWSKDGTVLGGDNGASGIGRNNLTISDNLFSKPTTIEVEIVAANEEILAKNSLTLVPQNPLVMVYENNPLYGLMFHREVGSAYRLEDAEITFSAFPFFLDTPSQNNSKVDYKWITNVGESQSGPNVTYRTPEEGSGSSSVSIDISTPEKIMTSFGKTFLVQFGHE